MWLIWTFTQCILFSDHSVPKKSRQLLLMLSTSPRNQLILQLSPAPLSLCWAWLHVSLVDDWGKPWASLTRLVQEILEEEPSVVFFFAPLIYSWDTTQISTKAPDVHFSYTTLRDSCQQIVNSKIKRNTRTSWDPLTRDRPAGEEEPELGTA